MNNPSHKREINNVIDFDEFAMFSDDSSHQINQQINLSDYKPSFKPSIDLESISELNIDDEIIEAFKDNGEKKS